MFSRLVRRRTIWWPTLWGWAILLFFGAGSVGVWAWQGERFFKLTKRTTAEVLIVEGWIGPEGVRLAGAEFLSGGYKYIVATGGMTGRGWSQQRWSFTEAAVIELGKVGVPPASIVAAPPNEVESQRTFEMALATSRALQTRGIHPAGINIFTRGTHGRRSRLVYSKVFDSNTRVGIISWTPPGEGDGPWWRSSARTEELIKETVAYFVEALFNSGRSALPATRAASPAPQIRQT